MANPKNQILNRTQITQKITRIAYQIYENNFEEDEIVLAGIAPQGVLLSRLLEKELTRICPITIKSIQIQLDKEKPAQQEIILSVSANELENRTIILIDDVLYTGRTFAYSMKPFLDFRIKKLQTVVLVDRGHTVFPISVDFAGYSLSTTVLQHIEVILDNEEEFGVYLS